MVDNLITLYEQNEVEFRTNGLGSLGDAVSCSVYEERNGEFELTMEYPVVGRHFSELIMRRIIFAKPNPYDGPQPFRIYDISTPAKGIVTVSAHHISYDLAGYTLAPFTASSLVGVFDEINRQMKEPWNSKRPPFTFSTTKEGAEGELSLVTPCSMKSMLGGNEGTILDRWPGEYKWDLWDILYYQNRGEDRGTTIEYGKNLTDLTQEENCENCWTSVYPYYYTEQNGLVQLQEKIIEFEGKYDHQRTFILNLTDKFDARPSEAQLRETAMQYVKDNELDKPDVSLTISFIALANTTNYANLKPLEEVRLCDTLHVYFPALKISSSSTCISTTYNVLTNKYTEVQLGKPTSDLASNLASQSSVIQGAVNGALSEKIFDFQSEIHTSIVNEGKLVTGNLGGNIVIYDSDEDGYPDTLFILETDDLEVEQNVLRWDKNGLAHSSKGYLGPFDDQIISIEGIINPDFVGKGG